VGGQAKPVRLTLDPRMQREAERLLARAGAPEAAIVASDVRNATRVPRSDDRIAKASASADFPLPMSPPNTIKSPRRNPPPSDLSMLGKPHEIVSRGGDPSLTASTRDNRTESGEMSVLRVIGP